MDSVYVNNVQDFKFIDSTFDGVLCVDIKLPKKFDATILPKNIRRLRILKGSEIQSPFYEVIKLKNLELCELTGKACVLLPHILLCSDKLNIVILNSVNLPAVWQNSPGNLVFFPLHVDKLILRNCRMNYAKRMYEYSLIASCIGFSCENLVLQDCSENMYYKIKVIEGVFKNQTTTLCIEGNCKSGKKNSVHMERRYSWIWRSIFSDNNLRFFWLDYLFSFAESLNALEKELKVAHLSNSKLTHLCRTSLC